MLTTVDAALAELDQEPEGPKGETSLELLQNVYRDRKQPLRLRVTCAKEALQHEYPRVSAVAVTSMSGQSFAEALDRAIERSRSPLVINALPAPEHPAAELKTVNQRYRRY